MPAERFTLFGVARFTAAWQGIEMPGGVGACCKFGQLVGDQRRRHLDQFLVVFSRQQVLAVFVRFPRRVQDAGYETGGPCREVRPETAWVGQPIDRCGPPDRDFVAVVERSSIGSGVSRQAMDDLEALPGNGLAAFDKPIVFAGALQFQLLAPTPIRLRCAVVRHARRTGGTRTGSPATAGAGRPLRRASGAAARYWSPSP